MSDHELKKLHDEIEKAKKESEDRLNSWKRTAADFENYKKRRSKEDQELASYIKEATIIKFLPVIEALQQGLNHLPEGQDHQKWGEGMKGVLAKLEETMKELGIEKIKTVGETYKHEFHEAVEMVEAEGKSGQIVEEVASGYRSGERVIRPAKVKVAK